MAARTPKIPTRNSLLSASLNDSDDIFCFREKEAPGQAVGNEGLPEHIGRQAVMKFDDMESFPEHKFKPYSGKRLQDMVESIREFGILEPIILWKKGGKHIILSGHNRKYAGMLAGLLEAPVVIKEDLSYEEAVLIVTETNLRQRSFGDLSHSERAYCLKQHYEAMKSQGRRNDLLKELEELLNPHEIRENQTLSENPTRLRTDEKLGEEYNLGKDKVAKYIRIADMVLPLLKCLDDRKLSFEAAYDLSFIREESIQLAIADIIEKDGCRIDTKMSGIIHGYAKNGKITMDLVRQIVAGEKRRKPKDGSSKPVRVREAVINRYFTGGQSRKEIEDTIEKALELYFLQNGTEKESSVG